MSYYRGDIDADIAAISDSPECDEAVMLDQIAKKIGYGRAQQILQIMWARSLRDAKIPTLGAILPEPLESHPAVKESLTTGDKRDIPEGWVFYSADASVADCVSVFLVRDEAGRNWWLSLSEDDKERIDMYATGKGKTLHAAIADASNNAMLAAAQKGETK